MPDHGMTDDPQASGAVVRAATEPAGAGAPLVRTGEPEDPGLTTRIKERWSATRTVLGAPRVRIELYGSDIAHDMHRYFTARHPRIRVAANKAWGVALLA